MLSMYTYDLYEYADIQQSSGKNLSSRVVYGNRHDTDGICLLKCSNVTCSLAQVINVDNRTTNLSEIEAGFGNGEARLRRDVRMSSFPSLYQQLLPAMVLCRTTNDSTSPKLLVLRGMAYAIPRLPCRNPRRCKPARIANARSPPKLHRLSKSAATKTTKKWTFACRPCLP